MLLMILEKVPSSLRGALSRWLIEPTTGVFLRNPSQRVREQLWKTAIKKAGDGHVLQIWSSRTPQGFTYREYGESNRRLEDFEGIALVVTKPKTKRKQANSEQKGA
jgi:CRISPR-associated protein Cas2